MARVKKNGTAKRNRKAASRHRAGRAGAVKHASHATTAVLAKTPNAPRAAPKAVKKKAKANTATPHALEKTLTQDETAPPGYIFVPKGDAYITINCRLQTFKAGKALYTVWDPSHRTILGHYVPTPIACTIHALEATTRAARLAAAARQDTLDAQRNAALITAVYPSIPPPDLQRVLAHAFCKGTARVGSCAYVRGGDRARVRLAVQAHIRHCHTPYEALLRAGVARGEARVVVRERIGGLSQAWARPRVEEGGGVTTPEGGTPAAPAGGRPVVVDLTGEEEECDCDVEMVDAVVEKPSEQEVIWISSDSEVEMEML